MGTSQCHECTLQTVQLSLAPPLLQFEGQTVLIGVDDMDVFKGIELKLQAVERVLDHHPEWRGRLTLVQVTNAPRSASWRLPACGIAVHFSWLHSWQAHGSVVSGDVRCKVQVISVPRSTLRWPRLRQQGALRRC